MKKNQELAIGSWRFTGSDSVCVCVCVCVCWWVFTFKERAKDGLIGKETLEQRPEEARE